MSVCPDKKYFNKRFYDKKALENYAEHSSLSTQLVKKKDVLSLKDCFNLYTKQEKLSKNDYWFCSKCKKHKPSTKKFDIWSLPKVLVLQLKRDKIDTHIDFPLHDLDIKDYLIQTDIGLFLPFLDWFTYKKVMTTFFK